MWQTISYYSALAIQSLVGVFGVRLYEEPHYDVLGHMRMPPLERPPLEAAYLPLTTRTHGEDVSYSTMY